MENMYQHNYTLDKHVIDDKTWKAFIKDVKKIIKYAEIELTGFDEHSKPLFLHDFLALNGVGHNACEPLILKKDGIEGLCVTDKKPYDIVVVACLMACKYHFKGHFELRSDGNFKELWPGMHLYLKATKE